jgi:transposase
MVGSGAKLSMTTSSRAAVKQHVARSSSGRVRPRRDFQAMEERRMRAVELFEQGVIPTEITRQLSVGRDGLRAAGRAGRRPKLNRDQLICVEAALANGAEANGYSNDLWTLDLAAEVIQRVTGVSYHPRPVFEDESGVSLLPSVRATWAPRGRTPVWRHRFVWKRLSLAGALAYEPDGSAAHLVFQLRPGAYNDETLIDLPTELNELEQQRPVLLIWDGLPSHRSRRMSDWVASQRHWLSIEPLPGYAPDLNPIEQVWGSLKSTELANLCSDTIDELAGIAEGGLDRIGNHDTLCFAFLRHAGSAYDSDRRLLRDPLLIPHVSPR